MTLEPIDLRLDAFDSLLEVPTLEREPLLKPALFRREGACVL